MAKFSKFLTLVLLLLLTSCVPDKSTIKVISFDDVGSNEVNHDYVEISRFRIAWGETYDQQLEEYFVYFFSRTCSHCQNLKNFMIEKALEKENIFFVESSEDDVIKKSVESTFYSSSAEFLAILGYPSLVKISEGILVENVAGESLIMSLLK